ncbi:hypothetical protein BCS42_04920 [Crenothrix sp. D3]|nr:hypothetical protein BCS42_04920 [Crenothrix sp. D3]
MDKKKNSLRADAVKQLHTASTTDSATRTRSAEELLYELQVHQIELEMQNENLRQSYEALAESQQDYFDLYEFSPVGYLTLSHQGLIEKINLTGATLLRESRYKLLQRRFAGFINATDSDRWHLFFAQVMRGNQQKTITVCLKQPNDNLLYAELHCLPMLKADHQPTLRIVLTDITASKQAAELLIANKELAFQNEEKESRAIERRKMERALQKSEEKLNFLLSNAPVTIFTCEVTPPFRLTYISPNIIATLGYLPEQFHEKCNFWKSNIHPDDVAQVYEHLSHLFKNDTLQHEHRFRTADGSYRWMYNEARLTCDEAGKPYQIIGFWVDISDRKKIEKLLTESERHLRAILDTTSECVKLVARDGTLLSINSSGLAMIEADSEDEVRNQCVYLLLAPEYRDAFQAFNEAVCDGKSGNMEFEIIGLKNTRHWMETHAVPFNLENGDIVQLAFTREITERKRLEKSLYDSESKFHALYDSSNDAIVLWDTVIFDCNQAALTLYGCKTVAEFCTYHPADLSPLEQPCGTSSLILAQQYIATALEKGQLRFEWTHKKIDTGESFLTEVLLNILILNEKTVLQATVHDITERKHAEMELRIAATIFESQTVGMMITDASTHIINVNQAFTNLTGYSKAEVLNQKPRILHSGRQDRLFYDNLWQSIHDSGGWQGEIWDKRKNGDIYPEFMTITAVRANQDQITHYVSTHIDITERKAAEEEIKLLAFYDPLTGLPNRRKLLDRLRYAIAINRRNHSQFAVFMMDLDKFKAVNDKLGHAAGDELLKQVAARITRCLRDSDMVVRLGGDEFVLVLENLKFPEAADIIALKVIADLTEPFQLSANDTVQIGASIGISLYPQHGNTPESLMDHADTALYQAKDNGRGCFVYFSGNELTLL